ncbi:MAG: hypothetical protein Q9201_000007 [Fulgogasparrea decipioides]
MREPRYGFKDMAFAWVKYPFVTNAERKMAEEEGRWDDSCPVWVACGLMLPCGWLFRGREWPSFRKGDRRRDWEREKVFEACPARNQTKYPQTRISPCTLKPRADDDNISVLSLDQPTGLQASRLNRLPLEIRQEIYGYVLGREENCLVMLPFKVRATAEKASSAGYIDVMDAAVNQGLVIRDDVFFWPQRTALLRSCRQIYAEAVDLLYSGNTFVIKHPRVFLAFAVPPQRLNSIRNLRIALKPPQYSSVETVCWMFHEWSRFWDIIVKMKRLKKLHVSIDYVLHDPALLNFPLDDERHCQSILHPMLSLSGLSDFKLDLRLLQAYNGMREEEVSLTRETKALVERIGEAAKRPRRDHKPSIDSEQAV